MVAHLENRGFWYSNRQSHSRTRQRFLFDSPNGLSSQATLPERIKDKQLWLVHTFPSVLRCQSTLSMSLLFAHFFPAVLFEHLRKLSSLDSPGRVATVECRAYLRSKRYDEGRDDNKHTDVELLRRRSNPASLPMPSLSFACDGFEDRGDPEDGWWLGWAPKIQDEDLP